MKHSHGIEQIIWPKVGRQHLPADQRPVPVYRVGEPFRHGHRSWPEGAQFTHTRSGHELTIFRSDINEGMVNEVRRGQGEFALLIDSPVMVLAYRFGESIPWNDSPYCWHLQSACWRMVPSLDDSSEARALLWVTLVGANDGIIHAQRGMTLSPAFTRALSEAIRAQAMRGFDPQECTSAISRVFLKYPSTADRLTLAVAKTMGNE